MQRVVPRSQANKCTARGSSAAATRAFVRRPSRGRGPGASGAARPRASPPAPWVSCETLLTRCLSTSWRGRRNGTQSPKGGEGRVRRAHRRCLDALDLRSRDESTRYLDVRAELPTPWPSCFVHRRDSPCPKDVAGTTDSERLVPASQGLGIPGEEVPGLPGRPGVGEPGKQEAWWDSGSHPVPGAAGQGGGACQAEAVGARGPEPSRLQASVQTATPPGAGRGFASLTGGCWLGGRVSSQVTDSYREGSVPMTPSTRSAARRERSPAAPGLEWAAPWNHCLLKALV